MIPPYTQQVTKGANKNAKNTTTKDKPSPIPTRDALSSSSRLISRVWPMLYSNRLLELLLLLFHLPKASVASPWLVICPVTLVVQKRRCQSGCWHSPFSTVVQPIWCIQMASWLAGAMLVGLSDYPWRVPFWCSFGRFHLSQGADVPLSDLRPLLFGIAHCLLGLLQFCDLAQFGFGTKGQVN